MKHIYEFCKNAERVHCSSTKIDTLNDLHIKIDITKDDVWRSRYCQDDSCVFTYSLGLNKTEALYKEIKYMKTIELFYPNTFSWRFTGEHIECIALIPMNKNNLGIIGRYGGSYGVVQYLRKQLNNILKYRDFTNMSAFKYISDKILATGSLNIKTDFYVVNISPNMGITAILMMAKNRTMVPVPMKVLDMKYWIREINPDFYKEMPEGKVKRLPITPSVHTSYPLCIKNIASMKKKGNYNRFLLSTFLLAIHNERDAKHQLDTMLSDSERVHINSGNCKGQWRAILAKKYPAPSCKAMIESGHCSEDCGRPHPTILNIEEEKTREVL